MKPVIDFNIAETIFLQTLGAKHEKKILRNFKPKRNERKTGYISHKDFIESNLIDCIVCVKPDGTLFLNVEFEFEIEVEIEVEKSVQRDKCNFDYISMINSLSEEKEFEYRVDYPLFAATIEISNKGLSIGDYKLIDITLM